jgi:ligand-binding sensor domain-containing protein
MLKKIILFIMALFMASGIYLLVNSGSDTAKPKAVIDVPKGFSELLKGYEFSAVNYCNGAVYAGGIQGLFKIDPETFHWEELKNGGKSYKSVRALYLDNNDLWVGDDEGLTILRDDKIIKTIEKKDGLKDTRIIDILRTDKNTVYAATFSGVAVIRDGNISFITKNDYLPGDSIKVMMKDSYGDIWLGAYNSTGGGIVIEKGEEKQFFNTQNGLVHNCITSFAETPDKKILVGGGFYTEGGASILENIKGKWVITKNLKKKDGLAGDKVRNIYIDNLNQLWFCSEYDGAAIFKEGRRILLLTVKDGLSDNEIKKIVQDKYSNYWLATRNGVTFVKQEAINKRILN